jgi:hypothetical protein
MNGYTIKYTRVHACKSPTRRELDADASLAHVLHTSDILSVLQVTVSQTRQEELLHSQRFAVIQRRKKETIFEYHVNTNNNNNNNHGSNNNDTPMHARNDFPAILFSIGQLACSQTEIARAILESTAFDLGEVACDKYSQEYSQHISGKVDKKM